MKTKNTFFKFGVELIAFMLTISLSFSNVSAMNPPEPITPEITAPILIAPETTVPEIIPPDITVPETVTPEAIDSAAIGLGTLEHYNVILFGDMVSRRADAEGAVAVNGNSVFGTPIGEDSEYPSEMLGFDMGSASITDRNTFVGTYKNPNNYPSFLSGGTVKNTGKYVNVFGGDVVFKKSYEAEFIASGFIFDTDNTIHYVDDNRIQATFNDMKQTVISTGEMLKAVSTDIPIMEFRYMEFRNLPDYETTKLDTTGPVIAFNVLPDENDSVWFSEINLHKDIFDYETIIVTSTAKKVKFAMGALVYDHDVILTNVYRDTEENKILKKLAEKIVWNFPNAEEITIERYGVIGSILAPNAKVTGIGGNVNGKLIAKDFDQGGGMEPHSFSIAPIWNYHIKRIQTNPQLKLKKVAEKTGAPLADAKFSLEIEDGTQWKPYEPSILSSGQDGFSASVELKEGKFRLTETTSPKDYNLLKKPIVFTVNSELIPQFTDLPEGVAAKVEGDNPKILTFTIENSVTTPDTQKPYDPIPVRGGGSEKHKESGEQKKSDGYKESEKPYTAEKSAAVNNPTPPEKPIEPPVPVTPDIPLDPMPKTGISDQTTALRYFTILSGAYIVVALSFRRFGRNRSK